MHKFPLAMRVRQESMPNNRSLAITSQVRIAITLIVLSLTIGNVFPRGIDGHEGPQQAPGTLDTSFGTGGIVTTSFVGGGLGQAVVQQPADGRLVVAGIGSLGLEPSLGTVTEADVARYNTDGSLDTTFGTTGTVTINNFFAFAAAIQPADGKIVLAGTTLNGKALSNFGLVRLNTDGSVDTTFGGGRVSTSFTDDASDCIAFGVAIQPNGQIVAAGGSDIAVLTLTAGSIAVARYNTDGSLDPAFGTAGLATVNAPASTASGVVIQSNGAIVVCGESGGGGSVITFLTEAQFVLARLNSNGTLDTTFGSEGTVLTKLGEGSVGAQLALQSDQKIVVTGLAGVGLMSDIGVARYNTDGSLDTTFGSGGMVTTNFDSLLDSGSSVIVEQDGKIVVAGMSSPTSALAAAGLTPQSQVSPANLSVVTELFLLTSGSKVAVVRYNTDGTLDSSFGTGGVVTTSVGAGSGGFGVLQQSDGKLVVAGASLQTATGPEQFVVARYEAEEAGQFSLQPNESSQTVDAGSSASFTISVLTASGSTPPTSNVALTASVSPTGSGITTTFNPSSVAAGSSSTLQVTVPSTTTADTYTVTVTGVSGSVTQTTSVMVDVASGPDFSIGFSSPTVTASPGSKVPITVEITRVGGFTGKVKVTPPTSLPTGVLVKPASVSTKGGTAAFTIKIKSTATAGSTALQFSGTDKTGRTRTGTVTLNVQ